MLEHPLVRCFIKTPDYEKNQKSAKCTYNSYKSDGPGFVEHLTFVTGLPAHTVRCKGRPYHWKGNFTVFTQLALSSITPFDSYENRFVIQDLLFATDVVWGYCLAFLVSILHLRSYHGMLTSQLPNGDIKVSLCLFLVVS